MCILKKVLVLFFLFCVMLSISSCTDVGEMQTLKVCGSYAVPGMFSFDLKESTSRAKIIEKDSYGRILFEYTEKNIITDEIDTVLVICQKYTSDYVYFYEDICYLFGDDDEDVEVLKENNDWNLSLNESKMSRRKINVSFGMTIKSGTKQEIYVIRELAMQQKNVSQNDIISTCLIDIDPTYQQLTWVSIEKQDGKSKEVYFVFSDASYNLEFFEIENGILDEKKFAEFKKECGWKYGIE